MTMTSKVPTTIRFVNWSYTRSLRMKHVSRALYEIYYTESQKNFRNIEQIFTKFGTNQRLFILNIVTEFI